MDKPQNEFDCKVCGRGPGERPSVFKNEVYCSDNHRKILIGELPWPKEYLTKHVHNHGERAHCDERCTSDLSAVVIPPRGHVHVFTMDQWQTSPPIVKENLGGLFE